MADLKTVAEQLLAPADVTINGSRPWDIQVHNDNLFARVLRQGSLGLGEAYMDGWWDAAELDNFFFHVLKTDLEQKLPKNFKTKLDLVRHYLFNQQRTSRAFNIGEE